MARFRIADQIEVMILGCVISVIYFMNPSMQTALSHIAYDCIAPVCVVVHRGTV